MVKPLKLYAEDAVDLAVVAACIQDAVVPIRETSFDPARRRFVMALNRFMWERAVPRRGAGRKSGQNTVRPRKSKDRYRVEGGVHFDSVLSVKTLGFPRDRENAQFELLTIHCNPGEEGAATITLVFAGGAAIKLEVECIDCCVADTGEPISTRRWPKHPVAPGPRGR